MTEIPLSKGYVALVDDVDAERVNQFKWHVIGHPGRTMYARRNWMDQGTRRHIYLHQFLMRPPDGMRIDHRNGDGLDCRRANMRFATNAQNQQNRRKTAVVAPYKGIFFDRDRNAWRAQIIASGRKVFSARFEEPEDAARAYDELARKHHGDFASVNFPICDERAA